MEYIIAATKVLVLLVCVSTFINSRKKKTGLNKRDRRKLKNELSTESRVYSGIDESKLSPERIKRRRDLDIASSYWSKSTWEAIERYDNNFNEKYRIGR